MVLTGYSMEIIAALVGVIATAFTVWRALSRKEVRLRHELEILKLHQDTGVNHTDVLARIEELKNSIYRATGMWLFMERFFYLITGIWHTVFSALLLVGGFILLSEGDFILGIVSLFVVFPSIGMLVTSFSQFSKSRARRIGA